MTKELIFKKYFVECPNFTLKQTINRSQFCKLIGLFNLNKDEWEKFKKIKIDISETFILKKIYDRLIAKQKGDFKLADQIRNELLSKGVVIEDQKDKTIWKLK